MGSPSAEFRRLLSVTGLTNGFGGVRSEQELGGVPGRKATPRRRCASESSISSSSSPLCDARCAQGLGILWEGVHAHGQCPGLTCFVALNLRNGKYSYVKTQILNRQLIYTLSFPHVAFVKMVVSIALAACPAESTLPALPAPWAPSAPCGVGGALARPQTGRVTQLCFPGSFSAPKCGRGKPALVRRHTLEDRSELISCIENGNYAKAARIAAGECSLVPFCVPLARTSRRQPVGVHRGRCLPSVSEGTWCTRPLSQKGPASAHSVGRPC